MSKYDIKFQPEDLIPNVVFSPEKAYISKEDKKKLGDRDGSYDCETKLLCRACGWNTYHEVGSSYLPRLRIFHTRKNSGLWTIGNDYVMWDRPGDKGTETNDYMTWKFLREQGTKIPLVDEMLQLGKEGDPFHFTIMSRVKGVPLENVYDKFTSEQKKGIADQLVAELRELRQYTAPTPQRTDGSPLWDNVVAQCWGARLCKTILPTKEEWLDSTDEELRASIAKTQAHDQRDAKAIDARIQELRNNFPESSPFVLTHGDLNLGNIIVDPDAGKILAIIDWELAGYYPWWVERWAAANRALDPLKASELFDMIWSGLSCTQA